LVDSGKTYKIGTKKLYTKCGWTPFAGMVGRGEIKKVVIRGEVVFENGEFVGKPQGRVIYPRF
jgi:dihydroorotase-like cyclic amidohydrolase